MFTNLHPMLRSIACILLAAIFAINGHGQDTNSESPPSATAEQIEFFERSIRPLLVEHCYECHSGTAKKVQAGFRLDSGHGLRRGGDSGTAVDLEKPSESLFLQSIRYQSFEMPPKGKLAKQDIALFEKWILMGAPWPKEEAPAANKDSQAFPWEERKAKHWAWRPVQVSPVPEVKESSWPRNPIDHYILSRLEQKGISPALPADLHALVRRLCMDLIGLPPTVEQIVSLEKDSSPQAIENLVDSLQRSPHFGERWGRHWLDLVRFAESRGHEFDNDAPYAYQYRDYVIRGLNADVPYDQWIREHIAGDLLESPRLHPEERFNESILGTGFWHLGEWVHSPVDIRKDETDRFDNMIDVMSKTFLGLTVSCARCHDHKFDPISSQDYYALSGFLQGSEYREVRFESLEHNRSLAQELAQLDRSYRDRLDQLFDPLVSPEESALRKKLAEKRELPSELQGKSIVDYGNLPNDHYFQDGDAFGPEPSRVGQWRLGKEVDGSVPNLEWSLHATASSDPFWNGLTSREKENERQKSKLLGLPRSGRTLRTPSFQLDQGKVQCRVRGSGHVIACVDSHRLVAGPLHGETIVKIGTPNQFAWVTLHLDRYQGHRFHLEFSPDVDATLDVERVLQGATPEELKLLDDRENESIKQCSLLRSSYESALAKDNEAKQKEAELRKGWYEARKELRSRIRKESHLAMAMWDGNGEDDHLLIRGNASKPGPSVPRRFLMALDGSAPMSIEHGTGRRALAERLIDPNNPFTTRVAANRVWHHLMGRGIVPTTDDFGMLGQPPSHPELLDHLATRFREEGYSLKKLIRYIVLSQSYRMGIQSSPEALALDPKNELWHAQQPKRLEGEIIRDQLLAISGKLDPTLFGDSVPIHLTSFMDGRGRPGKSGPLDGAGRRSIYIEVRRNFLSPFFLAFDTPVPFSTMGRRNVSNVPAQALILMNDPLVVELTQKWAQHTIEAYPKEDQTDWMHRIDRMYLTALGRHPNDQEMHTAITFVRRTAEQEGGSPLEVWSDLAHALVNMKEFIFLR